jgi:hypothetical protein
MHGRKQGNGGTREGWGKQFSASRLFESRRSANSAALFLSVLSARSDFVVGVVVKALVTPVNPIALQSKVKEEQAQHGELLQHARADR